MEPVEEAVKRGECGGNRIPNASDKNQAASLVSGDHVAPVVIVEGVEIVVEDGVINGDHN